MSDGAAAMMLGGYQLERLLGEGGSGTVYRARQLSTGQAVAIKFLRQEQDLDDAKRRRIKERFEREAQICSKLHHPHIVRLLDKGQADDGQLYAVFEYVPGETLKDLLLKRGALGAATAGELMGQVLDALACAHAEGIAHRDLKPHNVMVSTTGARPHVKVLDFGIAALVPEMQKANYQHLTLTQEALGTPSYSAPEQLRGEPPTTKTDLYAWGLLFLECLTGRPAIQGTTLAEIFHKQLSPNDVPLPPALIGHPLAALLRRVLHKNPRDRAERATSIYDDFLKLNLRNLVGDLSQPAGRGNPSLYVTPSTLSATGETPVAEGATIDYSSGFFHLPYERRQMTVLCCNLTVSAVGQAAEGGDIDLEVLDALQRDQLSLCTDAVVRYGGHWAGSLGDCLMFYFGYPYVTDSDARRASRAALELVSQVRRRSRLLEIQQGVHLDVRVGIHTGIVLARPSETPGGLTPNLALRLCRYAESGTILVSDGFRRLMAAAIAFEPAPQRMIGASEQPLPTFLLTGEYRSETFSTLQGSGARHPLLGREAELLQLSAGWRGAKAGKGRAIAIFGEAGIGKSRLTHEISRQVHDEGQPVGEWQCLPEHRNNALYPVLQMLKARWHLDDGAEAAAERVQAALEEAGAQVEWALPILCSWLSLPIPAWCPPSQHSPDRQKQILFDALVLLTQHANSGGPVLLVVEDAHWIDQTSFELLERLIHAAAALPLLVVLTARPEFAADWPALPMDVLRLERLSVEDTRRLIEEIIHGKPIDTASLTRLAERVDGIPLFVEELTRMLLDAELLAERDQMYRLDERMDTAAIPVTLRDSLTERLDRLGPAKETAQLAAVIGREFDHTLLVEVSLHDEAAVQYNLEQLVAADLIRRVRRVDGDCYLFRHALICDAAYDAMPKRYREDAHARVAGVLESRPPAEVDRNAAPLASHFAKAGLFTKAVQYGNRAAQISLQRSVYEDASKHASQVLGWLQLIDAAEREAAELDANRVLMQVLMARHGWADTRVKAKAERSLALLEKQESSRHAVSSRWALATYYMVAGDLNATQNISEQMVELSSAAGDTTLVCVSSAIRGMTLWLLGRYPEAAPAYERAIASYDLERDRGLGHEFGLDPHIWSLIGLANVRWFSNTDDAAAFDLVEHAVKVSGTLGHIPSQGLALMYTALIQQYAGQREAALASTGQLLDLAQKYGLPTVEAYGAMLNAWARGDVALADGILGQLRQLGCALGLTYYPALPAEIEAEAGDWDNAIRRIDECIALSEQIGELYYRAELHRRRANYLAGRGRPEDCAAVRTELEQALSWANTCGMHRTAALATADLSNL